MTTQSPVDFKFDVHDRVHSGPHGSKGAFFGVVTERFMSGTNKICYTVRDAEGGYWHRDQGELSLV